MGKYYQLAHSLMREMSGAFTNEHARVCAFQHVIHVHNMWSLESMKKERAESDCSLVHIVSGTKYVLVNFKLKNEMFSTQTCPNKKNIGYFVNFQAGQLGRSSMLLVSLVGPYYFQVFGAVWNGGEVCVDPLSDPVSLLSVPRDPRFAVEKFACFLICWTYKLRASFSL